MECLVVGCFGELVAFEAGDAAGRAPALLLPLITAGDGALSSTMWPGPLLFTSSWGLFTVVSLGARDGRTGLGGVVVVAAVDC